MTISQELLNWGFREVQKIGGFLRSVILFAFSGGGKSRAEQQVVSSKSP